MGKKQPRVNWRGGLIYLLLTQTEVLACAFFLSLAIYPIRMIFDVGMARDLLECALLIIIELAIRFFIFFALFKNQKKLTFGYFAQGYGISVGARLIFSLVTSFAAFSAGPSVLQLGTAVATYFTGSEIKSLRDVPMMIYIIVFVLFEALSLLMAVLASRLMENKREEERKMLINK